MVMDRRINLKTLKDGEVVHFNDTLSAIMGTTTALMRSFFTYQRSPRGNGSHTIKRVVIFSDTSALAATAKLLCREEAAHRLSYFDGKSGGSRCKLFLTCQTPFYC